MRAACALMTVVLFGCPGQGTSQPPPDAGFTLAIEPSQLTVGLGDAGTVTVSITRIAGFAEPIKLELVGPADALVATFSPNPATGDSATLTLGAADAGPGVRGLYVKGSAGAVRDATGLTFIISAPSTLTVTGRTVDVYRQPIAGLVVSTGSMSSTTDAEGRFSFSGISPPYELVVKRVSPLEGHVFRGLTRPDPVLTLLGSVPATARVAPVSGTLSGAGVAPLAVETIAAVFFAAPQGFGGAYLLPGNGPGFGPFSSRWYGDSGVMGTLHALHWSVDAQLLPKQFLGYASAPVSLTDAQAATQGLTLAATGTGFLSGTVAIPAGFTLASKTLWLTGGPFTGVFLGSDASPGTTFTYPMPDVGLPVGIEVRAERGQSSTAIYRSGLLPSEVVSVELPVPPLLQQPAPAATNVTSATPFGWSSYPGAIYAVFLFPAGGAPVIVYQAGNATTLPDLTALGLGIAKATAVTWSVWGVGPVADLDAFTAPERGLSLPGLDADTVLGVSNPATFTTAP